MEKSCFQFLQIILDEPQVKLDETPKDEVDYYQYVLKQLVIPEQQIKHASSKKMGSSKQIYQDFSPKRTQDGGRSPNSRLSPERSFRMRNNQRLQSSASKSAVKERHNRNIEQEEKLSSESAFETYEDIKEVRLQLGGDSCRANSPDGRQIVEFSLGQTSGFENMSKSHMKKTIIELSKRLEQQKQDHIELQNKLRAGYLKDIANLRAQVDLKEKMGRKFEYLEVRHFEPTDKISSDMCYILNQKLDELKSAYERQLNRLDQINIQLQKQIALFERLGEDGNIGIKFSEMNAESVIRKLQMIEKDPRRIWQQFDQYYGYGFFFDVLEYEFGITPETHNQLIKKFDQEISTYKNAAQSQISTITEKTQSEMSKLRKEVEQVNLEMAQLKQKHLFEIDRVKQEVEQAMQVKMEGQMAASFRRFDQERVELYQQLREYEQASQNYVKIKREFQEELAFTKLLFTAKIRSLKLEVNCESKAKKLHETEKIIQDRERHLRIKKNPDLNLEEELQEARNEIFELCEQMTDLQYKTFQFKKDRDYLSEKLSETNAEMDSLKQLNQDVMTQAKIYKDEYLSYKNNYDQAQKYIQNLENEVSLLKQKITRLNDIAEQFMQRPENIDSAIYVATRGSQKAINDLNINVVQKTEQIYQDQKKDKGTLTALFGLHRNIDKIDQKDKPPSQNKEIQANQQIESIGIQAEIHFTENNDDLLTHSHQFKDMKSLEVLDLSRKQQTIGKKSNNPKQPQVTTTKRQRKGSEIRNNNQDASSVSFEDRIYHDSQLGETLKESFYHQEVLLPKGILEVKEEDKDELPQELLALTNKNSSKKQYKLTPDRKLLSRKELNQQLFQQIKSKDDLLELQHDLQEYMGSVYNIGSSVNIQSHRGLREIKTKHGQKPGRRTESHTPTIQYKIVPHILKNMENILKKGFLIEKREQEIQTDETHPDLNELILKEIRNETNTFLTDGLEKTLFSNHQRTESPSPYQSHNVSLTRQLLNNQLKQNSKLSNSNEQLNSTHHQQVLEKLKIQENFIIRGRKNSQRTNKNKNVCINSIEEQNTTQERDTIKHTINYSNLINEVQIKSQQKNKKIFNNRKIRSVKETSRERPQQNHQDDGYFPPRKLSNRQIMNLKNKMMEDSFSNIVIGSANPSNQNSKVELMPFAKLNNPKMSLPSNIRSVAMYRLKQKKKFPSHYSSVSRDTLNTSQPNFNKKSDKS